LSIKLHACAGATLLKEIKVLTQTAVPSYHQNSCSGKLWLLLTLTHFILEVIIAVVVEQSLQILSSVLAS